jgi:hypothetical protein
VRPVFDEITAITDAFCARHLDAEYGRLCGMLAAKLARKRPSPLVRGDRRIWAAALVVLGETLHGLGDADAAQVCWRDASTIFAADEIATSSHYRSSLLAIESWPR